MSRYGQKDASFFCSGGFRHWKNNSASVIRYTEYNGRQNGTKRKCRRAGFIINRIYGEEKMKSDMKSGVYQ